MKIRLIRPSVLNQQGQPTKYTKLFLPNLGLPLLAALTPSGIDIGITIEYIEDIDFDEEVDLVGVTAQTCEAPRAYQIAQEFRKRGRKTVLGGNHAFVRPQEALKHFDSVVVGEADDIWPEVVNDAKAGQLKPLYTPEAKPSLDKLVIPRFDLLDYNQYMIPPFARTPLLPFQTTRGCPHGCDFCSVTQFWGQKLRTKPAALVVRELEALQPSRAFFVDDNITADPQHAMELFRELKPLRLRWASQMSTTVGQHPELIKAAAESGCHETYLGIESFNTESLKTVRKGFNKVQEYRDLFKRLADVGILAQIAIMFGLDFDNPDGLRRMVEELLDMDINYLIISLVTPLPGTRLYDRLLQDKRILETDWSLYDLTHVVFQPQAMSPKELENLMWEMFAKFYAVKNIFKRAWRFKRQYTQYFPRDNAFEEIFFQLHMRHAVVNKLHPFSLGLSSDPT
ncbi:MAG TPA: B12-binding domain-containing radical SAM protein [Verrucomicrobia bacterium]|nr:B12-binding domain-containing radical SAM protein [Verrucomicrobiota bacterium]